MGRRRRTSTRGRRTTGSGSTAAPSGKGREQGSGMARRTLADAGRSSSPTTTTRAGATRKELGVHRTKRSHFGSGSWTRTCGMTRRRRRRRSRKSCGPER
eukprot:13159925-Heterocapsa_arctica.AAC.1